MDTLIFASINGMAGHFDVIDDSFQSVAQFGPFVLVGLLLAMWFWPAERAVRDRLQWGVIAATIGASLALGVNQILIQFWDRPRPFAEHAAVLLLPPSHDPSFPSDHATFGFAVAVALIGVDRRVGIGAIFLACLLALSRVYTGEHYPSDVLAGALIGGAVAWAVLRSQPLLKPILDPLLRFGRRLHLA